MIDGPRVDDLAIEAGLDEGGAAVRGVGLARQATMNPMYRGAAAMMACVGIQGLTNLIFLGLASKAYSEADVGTASALFSAILLVTFITGMGLVVTVPLYANRSDLDDATVLTWVFIYTTATSVIGSAAYLAFAPSDAIAALRSDLGLAGCALFVFAASGISIATLTDVRMMADRKWSWIIVRNVVMGVGRIAALALPVMGSPAMFVFAAGSVPPAITGVVAVGVLPYLSRIRYHLFPIPRRLYEALRFATVNWFGVLVSQGPIFLVPVLVSTRVPFAANAEFFLAWSPAQLVLAIPTTMASVLLAESTKQDQRLRTKALEALGLSLVLVAVMLLGAVALQGPLRNFYGPKYPNLGTILLVLLATGIPWSFTAIGLSLARVRRDQFVILATTITGGVAVMVLVLVLVGERGIEGAALGWLLGNTVAAFAVIGSSVLSLRFRGLGTQAFDQQVEGRSPLPDEELLPTGAGQMEPIGLAGLTRPPSGESGVGH